ncbi:MAG: hypothetical protein ACOZAA_18630 [Pseudomonadota bacterium]
MGKEATPVPNANDAALAKADALRELIVAGEDGEEMKFRVLDATHEFGVDRATI